MTTLIPAAAEQLARLRDDVSWSFRAAVSGASALAVLSIVVQITTAAETPQVFMWTVTAGFTFMAEQNRRLLRRIDAIFLEHPTEEPLSR